MRLYYLQWKLNPKNLPVKYTKITEKVTFILFQISPFYGTFHVKFAALT